MNPSAGASTCLSPDAQDAAVALLQRRFDRERASRKAAEALLTAKSRELYDVAEAAREAERRLQLALWASGEGIWTWDVAADQFAIDDLQVLDTMHRSAPQPMAALLEMVEAEDQQTVKLAFSLYLRQASDDIDTAFRARLQGRTRWLRIRGRALMHDALGRPQAVTGTIKDVTAQREAEQSLHLMAQAFASTHDALVVIDARGIVVQANERAGALLEQRCEALEGCLLAPLLGMDRPLAGRGAWRGELVLKGVGSSRHVELSVTPVQQAAASDSGCSIVALRDISARRRAEDALHRQAFVDGLTGLANRVSVMQQLEERAARPGGGRFALLFIDLDGFKVVNDTLGHGAGDALLSETALRLRALVGDGVVGRLGGDEFVVLQAQGNTVAQALALADTLITHVGRPHTIDGQSVQVTPSIGIAVCPEHGQNAADLLRSADVAMYAAKEQGRNRAVVYHGALDQGRQRRLQLQQLLRADAERDAFGFVVQMQVNMHGRPVGGELLMRWQTQAFGNVSPAEFIPLAEQIGVIDRMGRLALRTAARVAHDLVAARLHGSVSVNLSPRQLLHDDVERALLDACMQAGAEPARIELELTESALVTDVAQVGALLARLAGHGFRLALDDFGTGYSSLSHLRRLPFHKVKIDRSFVQDLDIEPRSVVMLEGVVRLCDSLGLATVAEGVETREQFEMLRRLGVACFQGYWFARPQPLADWMAGLAPQGPERPVVPGGG